MKHLFLFFFTAFMCASANSGKAMPLAHRFETLEKGFYISGQNIGSKKIIAQINAAKPLKNVAKTAKTAMAMGLISVGSLLLLMLGLYLFSPVVSIMAVLLGIIFGIIATAMSDKVIQEKDVPKKYRSMALIGSIAGIAGALIMAAFAVFVIIVLGSL